MIKHLNYTKCCCCWYWKPFFGILISNLKKFKTKNKLKYSRFIWSKLIETNMNNYRISWVIMEMLQIGNELYKKYTKYKLPFPDNAKPRQIEISKFMPSSLSLTVHLSYWDVEELQTKLTQNSPRNRFKWWENQV